MIWTWIWWNELKLYDVFQLSVLHTGSNCSRRRRNWSAASNLSCRDCGLSSRRSWECWRSGWRHSTRPRPRACRPIRGPSSRSCGKNSESRCVCLDKDWISDGHLCLNVMWKPNLQNKIIPHVPTLDWGDEWRSRDFLDGDGDGSRRHSCHSAGGACQDCEE